MPTLNQSNIQPQHHVWREASAPNQDGFSLFGISDLDTASPATEENNLDYQEEQEEPIREARRRSNVHHNQTDNTRNLTEFEAIQTLID